MSEKKLVPLKQLIFGLSTDVEDPVFTACPTSPIKLKLYSMASSEMAEPKATDSSGLVIITVSPSWFRRDIHLVASLNVTYTAHDDAGRVATCDVTIEVTGESFTALYACVCSCVYV